MIDYSKPIRTQRGLPVTILSTEARGNCPVIGYIGESKTLEKWYADGRYLADSLRGEFNLENTPEYWSKEKAAFAQGKIIQFKTKNMGWSDCCCFNKPMWLDPNLIAKPEYRIKPKLVPLTRDDIKAGDTFLSPNPNGDEFQWTAKNTTYVEINHIWRYYVTLQLEGWKIKSLNETEWRPCHKEVE